MDDPELALENAIEHLQPESPEPLGMKNGSCMEKGCAQLGPGASSGNLNPLGHFSIYSSSLTAKKSAAIMDMHILDTGSLCSREEAFFMYVRERLLAVARDRDVMTWKVRNLLRQRGKSYKEIMSAEWYNLSEVESSLSPHSNDGPLLPSSIHRRHPLSQTSYGKKLQSPCSSLEPPMGCSKYQSEASDSGVCIDSWAAYEPTSARSDRLYTYIRQQNMATSHLPERERFARAAAIALVSNSPQTEDLSPVPCHANLCQRNIQYHSQQDNMTVSSTSDLFIPKLVDSTCQQDFNTNHKHSLTRRRHLPRRDLPRSRSVTLFVYTLNELPVPYAKRLNGVNFTLKDFKDRVFGRTGEYRYFFKSFFPDVNLEMFEEFSDENRSLPVSGGKVEARVERV